MLIKRPITFPLTLRRSGSDAPGHAKPGITVRRQLTIFYGVAAVTLIVLSVGGVLACRSVAQKQAFRDAERQTNRIAEFVVGPLLPAGLTSGSAERAELDRTIRDRTRDGYLVDAMAWDPSGRILWSTIASDIGRSVSVPAEVTAAIDHQQISSDFEDHPELDHPGLTPTNQGFVEVYVPFPPGTRPALAFEAYYDYSRVNETANALTAQLLPLVLVPLLLLQVIQVPIAASLSRRIRRQETERAVLLERNLAVSEKERVRIAADLHDGPIQDLAGIGYALGAIAPTVPDQYDHLMDGVQQTVHRATESLRRMMVDLYPPDLRASQLPDTLRDLAVPLRDRDISVDVSVEPVPELGGDTVTALYRVAREALANVIEHAQATQVDIVLKMDGATVDKSRRVRLDIIDNGVGIDLARLDRRAEGHLGLRLLQDRVNDLGGSLTFATAKGGGTTVSATLPVT